MAGHSGKYPRGPRRLTAGPFPRKRWGRGRLVPPGPGPPQRAIQRRHLVPRAAGSWWAFLKARTGAHYVDSNHTGAQAARLSVLRSAYAAASLSLRARGARECRVPGSREARFGAHRGSVIRPGLGAASSASPVWLGPGWGRRSREGRSLHQGRRRQRAPPLPALHLGMSGSSTWALRVTLGRPPCATSRRRAAQCQPILGARGRSSGGVEARDSGEQRARREDPAARALGPFGEAGRASPRAEPRARSPRPAGWVSGIPPRGGAALGVGCPWGPFPPEQERSLRLAAACGDQAPPREGAAPPCRARAWAPGCLVLVEAPGYRY